MFESITPKIWIMIITAFTLGIGVGAGINWTINIVRKIVERIFK